MKWIPSKASRESKVADGLRAASHFYKFLWSIRDELFSDGFEDELIATYHLAGKSRVLRRCLRW